MPRNSPTAVLEQEDPYRYGWRYVRRDAAVVCYDEAGERILTYNEVEEARIAATKARLEEEDRLRAVQAAEEHLRAKLATLEAALERVRLLEAQLRLHESPNGPRS